MTFTTKLRRSLRRRGLLKTVIYSIPFLRRRERFPKYLVHEYSYAAACVGMTQSDIDSPNLAYIWPDQHTAPWRFNEIFGRLDIAHERFTFIDIGSGKGLVLLMAAEFGFKKIIGLEIVPELAREAATNLQRLRSAKQKCMDVQSLCMDVLEFSIPDGPIVFYFYNPFGAELMEKLWAKIRVSYEANPRDIYLIYNNPEAGEVFDNHPLLRRIWARKARWGESLNVEYSLYKMESTTSGG
jgi:SAM-dependent methyltransferase